MLVLSFLPSALVPVCVLEVSLDTIDQVSILPFAATVTAVACSAAFPTMGSRITPMKAPGGEWMPP